MICHLHSELGCSWGKYPSLLCMESHIQSEKNHSDHFIQPLSNMKKIRKPQAVLILAEVSHARNALSPESLEIVRLGLDFGLLITDTMRFVPPIFVFTEILVDLPLKTT